MKLYVIRHADAASSGGGELTLTERGKLQAQALGGYFLERSERPDIVLTSPVRRARETAEELCAIAGLGAPSVEPWLACGMKPEEACAELSAYLELDSVVLVGHEPDLSFFLSQSLGGFSQSVAKASLTLLDYRSNEVRLIERFQG